MPKPAAPLMSDLASIYQCQKYVFDWPIPEQWRFVKGSIELSGSMKLTLPLGAVETGVSIVGLSLILEFDSLGGDVGSAVLRYCDSSNWHLGRFDFGDSDRHGNRKAISAGSTHLPAIVTGSHCHSWLENARFGLDAFKATSGCPPAALPIDDTHPSFRQRMRLVSTEFNIDGLDGLPAPPFQGDMLRR